MIWLRPNSWTVLFYLGFIPIWYFLFYKPRRKKTNTYPHFTFQICPPFFPFIIFVVDVDFWHIPSGMCNFSKNVFTIAARPRRIFEAGVMRFFVHFLQPFCKDFLHGRSSFSAVFQTMRIKSD